MTRNDNARWNWDSYYANVTNQNPRDILLKGLELMTNDLDNEKTHFAIDLGCGNGPDTMELLKRGWKVLAIDNEQSALTILEESIQKDWKERLETKRQSFDEVKLPSCDFIIASLSIPFCEPEHFPKFWEEIQNSLKVGGRFAGNFFGEKDGWANIDSMIFHTQEQVHELFNKFEIEYFNEWEYDRPTSGMGIMKHSHLFSVVGKKVKG